MKTLKAVLIALAVTTVIIALGIISCTVQLARGVNNAITEPSIEVKAAVEQTERSMVIAADAITINAQLVKDTQSDNYHAEIGIGEKLASALGITLEYKPASTNSVTTTAPDGTQKYSFSMNGGGYAGSYGSPSIAGAGGGNARSYGAIALQKQ